MSTGQRSPVSNPVGLCHYLLHTLIVSCATHACGLQAASSKSAPRDGRAMLTETVSQIADTHTYTQTIQHYCSIRFLASTSGANHPADTVWTAPPAKHLRRSNGHQAATRRSLEVYPTASHMSIAVRLALPSYLPLSQLLCVRRHSLWPRSQSTEHDHTLAVDIIVYLHYHVIQVHELTGDHSFIC